MSTATLTPPTTSLLGVYRPAEPEFVRGDGAWLEDAEGRRFLDFTSGLGVMALGHGSDIVADAVRASLDAGLVHTSNLFRTAPAAALAEWLTSHSFADAVFFSNSGAEANEAALKFARKWARTTSGAERTEVVAFSSSFHGRTYGALSVTDRPAYQAPFAPLVPGFRIVDPREPGALESAIGPRTAAVIVEPIQGEGGVRPLPPALGRRLTALCREAGALLIVDEVQVGLGRTGELWAHEAAGLAPDIMTLAKPLAGGLPMGATLVTERVAAAIQPGDHATTFGGGPLVASAALAVCQVLGDPAFLEGVHARSELVASRLGAVESRSDVVAVRGAGLIWGVQLDSPVAGQVVARALEQGLLLCPAGADVVRLLPPLNIGLSDLEAGLDLLEEAL
ncbi:MAG TPA: acetylornithine/succinylornithine family transaminase [Longimicrobiales bacterium]|nr:acetylornithine/succinylornithine family transaminase [Longimicrobiales bacterium]